MKTKITILELLVNGVLIGTINMKNSDKNLISVNGGKILLNGKYAMTREEITEMAIKKTGRIYAGKKIDTKNYQIIFNF